MNPLAATWLCWAIVGLSPIAGKYAVGVISPALLVFLGTLIGVLYFTPWVTKKHKWGGITGTGNTLEISVYRHIWHSFTVYHFPYCAPLHHAGQRGYFTAIGTPLFPVICRRFSERISHPQPTAGQCAHCTGRAVYFAERTLYPALDRGFVNRRLYLDVASRVHRG